MKELDTIIAQAHWLSRWSETELDQLRGFTTSRGLDLELDQSDEGLLVASLLDADGIALAGVAEHYGGEYVATDDQGELIGVFRSLREALSRLGDTGPSVVESAVSDQSAAPPAL